MNKASKTLLALLFVFALFTNNSYLQKVSAATQSRTFPESTSQSQTATWTIPNLKSVNSVSVNTGTVTYTISGDTITFTLKNGSISRSVQTGGSPADSKSISNYSPGTRYFYTNHNSASSGSCSYTTAPSSISYGPDSGGYSGTLSKTEGIHNYAGTCTKADGSQQTQYYANYSYSGTVTKPDTRTYTYYYQYTVTLNYTDNSVPVINITSPANNQTLSEVSGHNKLSISGTVQDTDVGDSLTVKYQIDSKAVQTLQTLTATGSSQNINNYDILVDGSISEGSHVVKVWVEDDKGGISSIGSRNFVVDKTPPAAPTFSEDPIGQAISKTITINFPSDANIKEYKIDNGNWTTYTTPLTLTKNANIYARAIDIAGNESVASHFVTSIGPPNPIVNVLELSEDSVRVTDTQTYPELVERQFSILKGGQIIQSSSWIDEAEYTFNGLDPNTIYDVKVDVRFK
ncbi:hypothetical protein P9302_00595 [Brevibacillus agri]|uniref:Fibronectin type-III domain-containing protein n=1 Tax=Brevibacillus brevis TaxID=1393 RepID=A0ABY9T1H0_BREBE|nr:MULTISPECIES: hypothetical protein [Brevibacillus]MED4567984.1 hypothetical protein [Brevibacillus agri]WNC13101.1 hypothetical protein RGB73_20585 [Brevibacillus brevis]